MQKVSVIVPVYNVEKYLDQCITSIINQTYQNIELILINDGSKDKSFNIMKKYKNNPKVIIFSQENHGAAYTRNFGLKKASGKYIMFVDSDDYISSDYIETYIDGFTNNIDVVLGGYSYNKQGQIKQIFPKNCLWDVYRFSATCGKMYRKDFLVKHSIEYGNAEFLEDVLFNLQCLFLNAKYNIIHYTGYIYRYNEQSISHDSGRNEQQIINIFSTIKLIDSLAHKYKYNNEKYLINYYLNTYLFMVFMCCKKSNYTFLKNNVNEFMKWLSLTYPNWKKQTNKIKEVDYVNRIVVGLWKGFNSIKMSNFLLFLYSKI